MQRQAIASSRINKLSRTPSAPRASRSARNEVNVGRGVGRDVVADPEPGDEAERSKDER